MSIIDILGLNKSPKNTLRIDNQDGGYLEIRTSGNIDLSGEYQTADANYKLEAFSDSLENYTKYFSQAKPGPSSAAE